MSSLLAFSAFPKRASNNRLHNLSLAERAKLSTSSKLEPKPSDIRPRITTRSTTPIPKSRGINTAASSEPRPSPQYRSYGIVLEKGLDAFQVADVEREINMIVNEGTASASSAIEKRFLLMNTYTILYARVEPAKTHVIERIRALKDVESITAAGQPELADISYSPIQEVQKVQKV